MKNFRQWRREQNGSAQIEFALMFPVMLVMLLGAINFGVILMQDIRVVDSARAGAEYGMLRAHTTDLTGIQNVAKASAAGIPNYAVTAVNYCSCFNGTAISCGSYTACGVYGLPNVYVKVTSTATLPLLSSHLPVSINVQSVALVRTAWTGGS